jgi:hypothetical protein
LESGYRKGEWHSEHRKYFLEALEISQPTFSQMIKLGKMSEDEFIATGNNFSSFHQWEHQKSIVKKAKRAREIAENVWSRGKTTKIYGLKR